MIQEQLKHGQDIEQLFGDVWTLKHFPHGVQDVKEFATLLNGCGRMGEGAGKEGQRRYSQAGSETVARVDSKLTGRR